MGRLLTNILLGEGTVINKYFTWGGDAYKQKFYLGRGGAGDVFKEIFFLGRGRL